MIYIPFHPDHLLSINFVKEEQFFNSALDNAVVRRQYFWPALSFSAINQSNRIVSSFGLVPIWGGRAIAWAIFDKDIGPKSFVPVAKKAKEMMEGLMYMHFNRLEAYIQAGYDKAERLAISFCFEKEGLMKNFMDGKDYFLYARVK